MRKVLLILVCCGAASAVLFAATASDDFNRADASTLGANWSSYSGGHFSIVSNRAENCTDSCAAFSAVDGWSATSFGADQFSEGTLYGTGTTLDYIGVAIHASGSVGSENNYEYYCSEVVGSGWPSSFLAKNVSGSGTALSSDLGPCASGDVLKVQNVGSTITAFRNGVNVGSVTDSSVTGGTAGIVLYVTAAFSSFDGFDDWNGGDVGGGGSTFPPGIINTPIRCCTRVSQHWRVK